MATYNLQKIVRTEQPIDDVVEATELAFSRLGGSLNVAGNTINISQGKNGVSMAFLSSYHARVDIRENKKGYKVQVQITRSPDVIFWLALIAGLCVILTWALNIMYFVSDPSQQYQMALDRIEDELDG